jgi:uncharacterized membrane protein HdeD (DUF308 family)
MESVGHGAPVLTGDLPAFQHRATDSLPPFAMHAAPRARTPTTAPPAPQGPGQLIGIYWLLGSLLTLRWLARHRRPPGNRLVWAAAILGIVAGLLVLLRFLLEEVLSTNLVLTLLGLTAILTGLLRLSGSFRDHIIDGRPRLPHRVALGVLELALGVLLLLARGATRPMAIAAGLWAVVGGTIMLVDALALRRMSHPLGQAET